MALWSFEVMVIVQSAAAWMCLILALLIIEPPSKKSKEGVNRIQIGAVLRHLFKSDPVLRNVVIAIPLYGLATVHAAWLMQPYWEAQGISLAMFGPKCLVRFFKASENLTKDLLTQIVLVRFLGARKISLTISGHSVF